VAALARIGTHRVSRRFGVASGALVSEAHAGVQARRRPRSKTGLVAGVAIRDGYASKAFIGCVIGRATIRWRERAAVARGALPRGYDLTVVELGRPPTGDAVAREAIGCA
jgi:hypothetical protein